MPKEITLMIRFFIYPNNLKIWEIGKAADRTRRSSGPSQWRAGEQSEPARRVPKICARRSRRGSSPT